MSKIFQCVNLGKKLFKLSWKASRVKVLMHTHTHSFHPLSQNFRTSQGSALGIICTTQSSPQPPMLSHLSLPLQHQKCAFFYYCSPCSIWTLPCSNNALPCLIHLLMNPHMLNCSLATLFHFIFSIEALMESLNTCCPICPKFHMQLPLVMGIINPHFNC